MIKMINLEKLKAIMSDYENFDDIFLNIEEEDDGPELTFTIIDRDDIEFEFASLDEGGDLDMMYTSINVLECLENFYEENFAKVNRPKDEEIIYEDLIEFILYGFKDDIKEKGQLLMDISSALMLEKFGDEEN